jgi:hypothetical protein
VVPGLDVTAITPGRPNFLVEALGFDPAVSMHFVLDKTALALARWRLAKGLRSFLGGSAGDVVVLYGDVPVAARRPWGAWVRRGYDDFVESQGWRLVATVVIPRAEPGAGPAQPGPASDLLTRFIAWEHTNDAGSPYRADLDGRSLALRVNDFPAEPIYTLVVDGVALVDLDDWPEGWRRPATSPTLGDPTRTHTNQPSPPRDMMITPDVLATWSRRLCGAIGDAVDVARSLGLTGRLTRHGDFWDLTPPPKDTRILFVRTTTAEDPGTEEVGYIDITPPEPVSRGALDARFGPGEQLPQVHPGRPYKIAYHVSVPGAPYSCEVIAAFTDQPTTSETLAHGVVLRRDRNTP